MRAIEARDTAGTAPGRDDVTQQTLAAILREQREQRALLEQILTAVPKRHHGGLSRGDRDRVGRMLPAIGGALGSEWFLTRELFASEAEAVRLVLRGLNARQLGGLFRRAEGQAIDGYRVQRAGAEAHAILWQIVELPELSGVRNSVPPLSDGRSPAE